VENKAYGIFNPICFLLALFEVFFSAPKSPSCTNLHPLVKEIKI